MKLAISNRAVINMAAAAEGAAFTIYAAYSRILISKQYLDLTAAEYGWVFLPEIATIITTAVLAARITRRIPTKQICPLGLGCSLVSMVLLLTSAALAIHMADYPVLLVSSAFLGAGFGLAIPALITYAVILTTGHPERPVLAINALLAAGMAAPPILGLAFTAIPFWWGPAMLSVLLALLMTASRRLPATRAADAAMQPFVLRVPARVKSYGLLVILYGLCTVMLVAWSQLNPARPAQPHLTFRALVLGAFWATLVMLARVLFAMLDQMPSGEATSTGLLALAGCVAVIALVADDDALAHISIWVLAALACAAFLPLRFRAGTDDLSMLSVAFASGVAILYPLGLGLAKASLETMRQGGLSVPVIFGIVSIFGVVASIFLMRVLWPHPQNPPS